MTLEAIGTLEPRRSALEDDFEEEEEKDEDDQLADGLDSGGHDKVQFLIYLPLILSLSVCVVMSCILVYWLDFIGFACTTGLLPWTKSN